MTSCRTKALQQILLDMLEERESDFGVPLLAAKTYLMSKAGKAGMECTEKDIDRAIQIALDNWLVDKVLAPLTGALQEKLGVEPPGPFWHLKKLTPQEQAQYESLAPVEKALIRILREQNTPGRRGQIRVEEAEETLSGQGFDDVPKDMWVKEILDTAYRYENGGEVKWYGLVEEHLKTEEYKKHREQMLDEQLEKQRRYIQLMDDLDKKSNQKTDKGNGDSGR